MGPMRTTPKSRAFPPSEYGDDDHCTTCGSHYLEPHDLEAHGGEVEHSRWGAVNVPPSNPHAPVSEKNLGDGHKVTVYAPHRGAPIDEYQTRPGSNEQGPLMEQGVVPATGTGQHEWVHSQHGEPINGGHADSAPEALAAGERSHAELTGGWDPDEEMRQFQGYWMRRALIELEHDTNDEDWDHWNEHAHTGEDPRHEASRRQAWSGWGPSIIEPERHAAKGWDWDDHLLAYTSSKPRKFTCSCGQQHPAVGYSNCKCGKIWNGYVIGTGGDRHQASAEQFLVREIPVRPEVIVANRKVSGGQRNALTLGVPRGDYDWESEAAGSDPWPTDHHPSAGDSTMKQEPEDWHHRERGKFTPGHKPGPGVFTKQDL